MAKRKNTKKGSDKSYRHPVPGRTEILDYLRDSGKPMPAAAIADAFRIERRDVRAKLGEKLKVMRRAGQIIQNRLGEYCLIERLNLITGTVAGHPDGFGFVRRDDGDEDDVYLSAREMRSVFDGDKVAVRLAGEDHRGRSQGKVVEVLERGTRDVAGQFIRERGVGVVIPDNTKISHRILIAKGEAGSAKHGQIVVARILDYPTHVEQATGKIIKVVGDPDDKGIATDIAIHAHAIPVGWPRAVSEEAKSFGKEVPAAAKQGRVDLRDVNLVTIDGADARDFDDAVYCEPSGKGFRLIVAIADVAHYVQKDSAIDREATKRGTSVYFPDRVVPMLPVVLSNGLCSLNPKVDRLCMVCDMRVGADGKVSRAKFYDAVMRSAARLTYSQVSAFLEGEKGHGVPKPVQKEVRALHQLFRAFASNRRKRGAVELDIPQTRIEMDPDGTIKSIRAVPRNDAHRLIEECMIAANVQAAKFVRRHRIPALFRVHAKPEPDRFNDLRLFLVSLGLKVPHPDHVQSRDFNRLIEQVRDRPDAQAISMAMLRSMMHAEYTPTNIGHFGLALGAYAHFTSPIRRYPDLLVHRAIRHITSGGKAGNYSYDRGSMERLGIICSAHERRAEEATREVEAWLKCQYMEDKIGEQYPGVVTGVTSFGVFVQIPALQIDGLVHVTSLDSDYYQYDAGRQALIGDRTGKTFTLGDKLDIVVARVDLDTRRIDFNLADNSGRRGRQRTSRGRNRR